MRLAAIIAPGRSSIAGELYQIFAEVNSRIEDHRQGATRQRSLPLTSHPSLICFHFPPNLAVCFHLFACFSEDFLLRSPAPAEICLGNWPLGWTNCSGQGSGGSNCFCRLCVVFTKTNGGLVKKSTLDSSRS